MDAKHFRTVLYLYINQAVRQCNTTQYTLTARQQQHSVCSQYHQPNRPKQSKNAGARFPFSLSISSRSGSMYVLRKAEYLSLVVHFDRRGLLAQH